MFGSILVKMPVITKEFDDEIGVEIINKYFVRLKGDVYMPIFNLPVLYTEAFYRKYAFSRIEDLVNTTLWYYKWYTMLRKYNQFKIKVFLPEKYGGNALYYLLQKFMIGEAILEEIKIVSEFLSRDVFDGEHIHMEKILQYYYDSIFHYFRSGSNIPINTPIGVTPLYIVKLGWYRKGEHCSVS